MLFLRLFWLVSLITSFRIINPDWTELIRHVLIESDADFYASSDWQNLLTDRQDLLDKCDEGLLSPPFPQFLCALLRLRSMSLVAPTGPLNATYVDVYNEAVSRANHPCNHSAGESCVVLFLPLNRILFGCSAIDGDLLQSPATFNETFVVSHRVADGHQCEVDGFGDSVCSTESVFMQGLVVQEQHSCCCGSGRCAVLYFDQGSYMLPFIRIVIDVEETLREVAGRKKREAQPMVNGGSTPDLVIGGGFVAILAVAALVLWYVLPDMDASDGQEAMAYGMHPEMITKMFPRPMFTLSMRPPSNNSQSEQQQKEKKWDKEEAARQKQNREEERRRKVEQEDNRFFFVQVDSDTIA